MQLHQMMSFIVFCTVLHVIPVFVLAVEVLPSITLLNLESVINPFNYIVYHLKKFKLHLKRMNGASPNNKPIFWYFYETLLIQMCLSQPLILVAVFVTSQQSFYFIKYLTDQEYEIPGIWKKHNICSCLLLV